MKKDKDGFLFIHVSNDYCLCTTELEASENTIDINFYDFAEDEKLLEALHLCTALLRPAYWWSDPMKGQRLYKATACYLASFAGDCRIPENQKLFDQRMEYLMKNGIVRIVPGTAENKAALAEWQKNRKTVVVPANV